MISARNLLCAAVWHRGLSLLDAGCGIAALGCSPCTGKVCFAGVGVCVVTCILSDLQVEQLTCRDLSCFSICLQQQCLPRSGCSKTCTQSLQSLQGAASLAFTVGCAWFSATAAWCSFNNVSAGLSFPAGRYHFPAVPSACYVAMRMCV